MFTWLRKVMARRAAVLTVEQVQVFQQEVLRLATEREQERTAAVQALAWPRRMGTLVLLPPGLPLQQALQQAQELRRQHPQGLSESSPRSSTSKPQTDRRISQRRGRR